MKVGQNADGHTDGETDSEGKTICLSQSGRNNHKVIELLFLNVHFQNIHLFVSGTLSLYVRLPVKIKNHVAIFILQIHHVN